MLIVADFQLQGERHDNPSSSSTLSASRRFQSVITSITVQKSGNG